MINVKNRPEYLASHEKKSKTSSCEKQSENIVFF